MEKYFLIPVMLLLMSAFVFAGMGANLNSAINLTAKKLTATVSVSGNASMNATAYKMPKVNKSHMLIMPNPMAQIESELRECMLNTSKKHRGLSSFEVRYYCSQKLHVPIMPSELKVPKLVLNCILNLTVDHNLPYSEARAKCYENYVNKTVNLTNSSSVEKYLNDSGIKKAIMQRIIHNEKARQILQNPKIVKKLINLSNLSNNKTELKAELRVLMRTRTSRQVVLSQLRKEKRLLMNKTVLSAFMPEHINLSNAEILNATVKDNSSIVVRVRVRAKLFGFIPVPMTETIVNNGNVTVKRPFWSFLAKLG